MGERCGDWFFIGALAAILAFRYTTISSGWAMVFALLIGWAINENTKERS